MLAPTCPQGVELGEPALTPDRGNSIVAPQVGKHCGGRCLLCCCIPCCYCKIPPDPLGYGESHPWRGTAKQILTKDGATELRVPDPLKFPEEVKKSLDTCKTPAQMAWDLLHTVAHQHAKSQVLRSWGLGAFSQIHHITLYWWRWTLAPQTLVWTP